MDVSWKIKEKKGFNCDKPILIEGLPGIGNVGKLVVDYLVESLKAKKVIEFSSFDLPNSVFVVEDGSVQLPGLSIYHAKKNKKNYLFLVGDAQPSSSRSSYELTNKILQIIKKYKGTEILALGGIGLPEAPTEPKLYVAGNDKKHIQTFKKYGVKTNAFGIVGPIVGVSGLLVGLSKKEKILGASLLSETYGHPLYIGLNEARVMLEAINKKYKFGLDLSDLDEELEMIDEEEDEMMRSQKLAKKSKRVAKLISKDMSYIG